MQLETQLQLMSILVCTCNNNNNSPIWAPLQPSRERQPNRQQATSESKVSYQGLEKTHISFPVAIETAGSWSHQAIELVQEIGRRTTVVTEDSRETTFLFQRLSGLCRREMRSHS